MNLWLPAAAVPCVPLILTMYKPKRNNSTLITIITWHIIIIIIPSSLKRKEYLGIQGGEHKVFVFLGVISGY